jgi:ergothioneine biosynthesis protein EgtB
MTPVHFAARYREVRGTTERLCKALSPEDCTVQSMPDASPAKWHLAHTTWFFETFVLAKAGGRQHRPFDAQFRTFFNSYYHSVGEQHPRPERGMLTRPSLEEVFAYRTYVDEHVLALLEREIELPEAIADVLELGLHHEQQHQELILTDAKHLLSRNPLRPAYRGLPEPPDEPSPLLRWSSFDEELGWAGYDGPGFAFDNERPRHRVFLQAFELASRPVSNAEFLGFVGDGGYRRSEFWLSDGWDAVRSRGWSAPLYWERHDDDWYEYTLGGLRRVGWDDPVCHVSYYEADAYARWAGTRLPRETEWERAAQSAAPDGNFQEGGWLCPVAASGTGTALQQLFGDVWEWTGSPHLPYPGYRPPSGALGEYNGKFMCNQMVLRGGSCVTPQSHIRRTYRNFFYPDARWQFSGIRLARDAG